MKEAKLRNELVQMIGSAKHVFYVCDWGSPPIHATWDIYRQLNPCNRAVSCVSMRCTVNWSFHRNTWRPWIMKHSWNKLASNCSVWDEAGRWASLSACGWQRPWWSTERQLPLSSCWQLCEKLYHAAWVRGSLDFSRESRNCNLLWTLAFKCQFNLLNKNVMKGMEDTHTQPCLWCSVYD